MRRRFLSSLVIAIALPLALPARSPAHGEPDAIARVLHRLPFPAGVSYRVMQGNDQGPSHTDVWNKYAWDFGPMPIGSDVCASADGIVEFVKEDVVGPTGNVNDNNELAIRHVDGTVSVFAHLQRDGVLVDVDQKVLAGDVVAKSGNTGKSDGPHLHWSLKQLSHLGEAIPAKFEDVAGDGIPKTRDTVTSQNVPVRLLVDAMDRLDATYDRAKRLDCLESMVPTLALLAKEPPPADIAAVLARYGPRADTRAVYADRKSALLARHRADADATVASVGKAREGGRLDEAVALASCGRLDYATIPAVVAGLDATLAELKKDPAYAKSSYALQPRLAWRRELVHAFDLEAKARERLAAGKKGGWKTVLGLFDGLVSRAPSADVRTALSEYVAPLKAMFGKAE